jgi:hypothetical protein
MKRLRSSNQAYHTRLEKTATGHVADAKRYLSKTHTNLCNSTRTLQDVRRDLRVACEEVTELSVECMNLAKRRPPFFALRNSKARSGDFTSWEQLSGVSTKQDDRYRTLLSTNATVPPAAQILKDIPRTPSFGDVRVDEQKLKNVLHAYNLHDPTCAYVQGMNTVASFLLSKQEEQDDERVFWVLVQILGSPKYNMRGFYMEGMPQLHIAFFQFDKVLKQRLERISKHFVSACIETTDYLSSWYLSLFTAIPHMSITLLSGIFEYYLDVGYVALLTIALGLLALHEQKLLTLSHDAILTFLKRDMWRVVTDAEKDQHKDKETKSSANATDTASVIDLNSLIAAASKPQLLEQRELDRMEVEYQQHQALKS